MGSRPSLATERLTNRPSNATVSLLFTSPAEGWNLKGWKKHHVSGLPAICVPKSKRNEWNWLCNYILSCHCWRCLVVSTCILFRFFGSSAFIRSWKNLNLTRLHIHIRYHVRDNISRRTSSGLTSLVPCGYGPSQLQMGLQLLQLSATKLLYHLYPVIPFITGYRAIDNRDWWGDHLKSAIHGRSAVLDRSLGSLNSHWVLSFWTIVYSKKHLKPLVLFNGNRGST